MRRTAAAAALMLALAACAADSRIQRSRPPGEGVRVGREDRIYVMRPADGSYRGKPFDGSGDELFRAIVDAFSAHTSATNLLTADTRELDLATALDRARESGAAYLLQPAILRWEERATQWSGKPDRVRLRLTLFDVAVGEPVDAADIRIEGPEVVNSGQRIGALLRDPLIRYAGALF